MNFEGKKVLLVEQDSEIAWLMAHILETAGCDVRQSTPTDCLNDIALYQPGVILLDHRTCSSTSLSTYTLLSEIHTAHLPVILTSTASNVKEIASDCLADDFVSKPFDIEDLENKVLYWLSFQGNTVVE